MKVEPSEKSKLLSFILTWLNLVGPDVLYSLLSSFETLKELLWPVSIFKCVESITFKLMRSSLLTLLPSVLSKLLGPTLIEDLC